MVIQYIFIILLVAGADSNRRPQLMSPVSTTELPRKSLVLYYFISYSIP